MFFIKQNFINNLDLDNLNNDLLNYIYKNKYEKRVLAVDGSYLKTLSILKPLPQWWSVNKIL